MEEYGSEFVRLLLFFIAGRGLGLGGFDGCSTVSADIELFSVPAAALRNFGGHEGSAGVNVEMERSGCGGRVSVRTFPPGPGAANIIKNNNARFLFSLR